MHKQDRFLSVLLSFILSVCAFVILPLCTPMLCIASFEGDGKTETKNSKRTENSTVLLRLKSNVIDLPTHTYNYWVWKRQRRRQTKEILKAVLHRE